MAIKRKRGRPSMYTDKLAEEICYTIATTIGSIKKICEDNPHFPSDYTIFNWLHTKQDFARQYARAKEQQADVLFDTMLSDARTELIMDEKSTENVVNGISKLSVKRFDNVNRSKLIVDTTKWYLSKTLPKKFGDAVKLSGDAENPINVTITKLNMDDIDPSDYRK